MKIKKLTIKNIRSYEDQEIVFPEGSLLLSGDVGSGKTSILLAIEYALFGLQPGQTGSALLRNNSQSGGVTLEIELDDSNIIIERKLKKGKTVTNEYSALTVDGVKTEYAITELKTRIIQLLGYPSEFIKKNNLLYKYTVYTPQEQMKQIISEDPETRLNMLRHIFGVEKYKRIRENLVILLNKLKEESKVLQIEISAVDSDKIRLNSTKSFISLLGEKIISQDNIIGNLKSNRKAIESEVLELEKKIKEKEKLETELEKTKVLYSTKRDNLADIEREHSELSSFISSIPLDFNENDLLDIIGKISTNNRELDSTQISFIDCLSHINSLKQRKTEALSKKERVFKIDICPTCLQDVPPAHKHNIFNETEQLISAISKEIENFEAKKVILTNQLDILKDKKQEYEEKKMRLQILKSKIPEIERAKNKIISILKNKDNLKNDVILLLKHMDGLKESILSFSRFNTQYKTKQQELRDAFLNEKNAEISLAELKKELEITNKEILVLEETIKQKEGKKEKLNEILELSDWLSNQFISLISFTERNVMLKLRTEFSKLFSKWFSILVQDTFEVQLDENFTPIIMQSGIEMDYSFLSGGERTAVALAYRLALNQTISTVMTSIKTKNIIILDEPTEGFSEIQIDKMREILIELKAKQLILVSHEQKMDSFVDSIIKVRKEAGISKVESISK